MSSAGEKKWCYYHQQGAWRGTKKREIWHNEAQYERRACCKVCMKWIILLCAAAVNRDGTFEIRGIKGPELRRNSLDQWSGSITSWNEAIYHVLLSLTLFFFRKSVLESSPLWCHKGQKSLYTLWPPVFCALGETTSRSNCQGSTGVQSAKLVSENWPLCGICKPVHDGNRRRVGRGAWTIKKKRSENMLVYHDMQESHAARLCNGKNSPSLCHRC